jgi:hypothetical protein
MAVVPFARSCTVSPGKALLLNLNRAVFGAGMLYSTPTVPDVLCDLNVLRQAAARLLDANGGVDAMKVEVDGMSLSDRSATQRPAQRYGPYIACARHRRANGANAKRGRNHATHIDGNEL